MRFINFMCTVLNYLSLGSSLSLSLLVIELTNKPISPKQTIANIAIIITPLFQLYNAMF
ncbi:MAG: hypothetical protein ACI9NI_000418 [Olleya marilimosa]|jgi:hypothetical protein